jgi:hypothetical protein
MGPLAGGNSGQACVFDAQLFAQQPDLLVQLILLCRQASTVVAVVGCPTPGLDQGIVRQGHDLDEGRLDLDFGA